MDIAEAMLTVGKLEVGAPVIMQSSALVVGQDGSSSHADMPAFGMDVVLGQFCCAGHVQPLQPPCDTHTTLIEMDDRSSNQALTNLFQACLCALGKLAGGGEDDRLRRRTSVERSQQLSDARQGDELLAVQVAGECLQTRTILGGLRNLRGKLSLYARTTARTLLHLCLMLGHLDAGRRYVKYLPFLIPFDSLRLQLCLTTRAIRQPMNDDMVRFCHLHQGASFVPALPPTRPLARATQTLALAFLQTIAARRLAAVVTVFRQLILQLLDQRLVCGSLFLRQLDHCLLLCHLLTQGPVQRKALSI